ncbi:MAG TPA: response regulator [Caulobacteraceae bacterium]
MKSALVETPGVHETPQAIPQSSRYDRRPPGLPKQDFLHYLRYRERFVAVILVVEDNFFIREVAEMLIQDLGYSTLSAGDGDEALLILQSPQQIDALFTDIYLKDDVLGGCELAIQAAKIRPSLRVLYTTGNFVNEAMKDLFVNGKHFLSKPYSPDQLKYSVDTMFLA